MKDNVENLEIILVVVGCDYPHSKLLGSEDIDAVYGSYASESFSIVYSRISNNNNAEIFLY